MNTSLPIEADRIDVIEKPGAYLSDGTGGIGRTGRLQALVGQYQLPHLRQIQIAQCTYPEWPGETDRLNASLETKTAAIEIGRLCFPVMRASIGVHGVRASNLEAAERPAQRRRHLAVEANRSAITAAEDASARGCMEPLLGSHLDLRMMNDRLIDHGSALNELWLFEP